MGNDRALNDAISPPIPLKRESVIRLRRTLLQWYARTKRDLPWRRTDDPYHILVVEYMSQQTQVDRVLQYYDRFVRRFPDIRALARASPERVLKAWEGMGYYARARHLQAAARQIVRQFDGRIPDDPDLLMTLPGCGPYTAAAIASIAFNKPVPVLDGNVIRVLCRLWAVRENPRQQSVRRRLRTLAEQLVPRQNARQFNQALMELGALICTPRSPQCEACCWNFACQARKLSSPAQFPVRAPRRMTPHYQIAVGIVWKDGRLLIGRRPTGGLLGGLWEFPGGKRRPGESFRRCCAREIEEETGVRVRVGRQVMTIRHAYSHFRITMHVFECQYLDGEPRPLGCERVKWVSPRALHRYPFPAANRKLIEKLRQQWP